MRNFFYALLAVVIIAALVIVINWNSIMVWWNRPKEGSKCVLANEPAYVEGVIKDGKCVSKNGSSVPYQNNSGSSNGNNSSSSDDLQVSNPNGAYMYYQSLSPASGGMIYGKSNFSLPYGTKLKLVKVWQTNVSTQPFAGYYETNFKQQFGANSGFFRTEDIIKL